MDANTAFIIYQVADQLVREINSKKANRLRNELNALLAKNNLKINKIRSELERRGISYNVLMDSLYGTSPVGSAARLRNKAMKEYGDVVKEGNAKINEITNQSEHLSNMYNSEASDIESKGLIRTITGDIIK